MNDPKITHMSVHRASALFEEFGAIQKAGNEDALDAMVMGCLVGVLFMMKETVSESDALRVIAGCAEVVWADNGRLAVPERPLAN